MNNNIKIYVSDEVSEFIKSYNCETINSEKLDKYKSIYWNECKYISTEDDNVFEIIFPSTINSELLNNRLDNE